MSDEPRNWPQQREKTRFSFWKAAYPELVWLPLPFLGLLAGFSRCCSGGLQYSRSMPWTRLHCSEWTGAVQDRSLLCWLGCPRAAKPALMARSGIGIIRQLPHSLGEWMLFAVLSASDEPIFPLYSPLLHTLDDGDVPQEVSEQYVLVACRIWWRFHWDGFFGRSLRFVPAAWPCRRFCLDPQCCSLPGRHCCKQLIELHGSDDRAMTCLWILVANCGMYL